MQLHVHLSMFLKKMSKKRKEELINESFKFFVKEIGVIPTEIVFGWWSYDKESKKIAKSLGLKIIDKHYHVYDWWLK